MPSETTQYSFPPQYQNPTSIGWETNYSVVNQRGPYNQWPNSSISMSANSSFLGPNQSDSALASTTTLVGQTPSHFASSSNTLVELSAIQLSPYELDAGGSTVAELPALERPLVEVSNHHANYRARDISSNGHYHGIRSDMSPNRSTISTENQGPGSLDNSIPEEHVAVDTHTSMESWMSSF
jgi:hypothetical protein